MKKRGQKFQLKFKYKNKWLPHALKKLQLELESQGQAVSINDLIIAALEDFLQHLKEQSEKELDVYENFSFNDVLPNKKIPCKSRIRKITFPKQDEDLLRFLDSIVQTRLTVGQRSSLSEEVLKLVRIGFNQVHLQRPKHG